METRGGVHSVCTASRCRGRRGMRRSISCGGSVCPGCTDWHTTRLAGSRQRVAFHDSGPSTRGTPRGACIQGHGPLSQDKEQWNLRRTNNWQTALRTLRQSKKLNSHRDDVLGKPRGVLGSKMRREAKSLGSSRGGAVRIAHLCRHEWVAPIRTSRNRCPPHTENSSSKPVPM